MDEPSLLSDEQRSRSSSIAVDRRMFFGEAAAVLPAAWTSPRSYSRRLMIADLLPLDRHDSLEFAGCGGHAGGAHEATLFRASPVDDPPYSHSLDNPLWIACRTIRLGASADESHVSCVPNI